MAHPHSLSSGSADAYMTSERYNIIGDGHFPGMDTLTREAKLFFPLMSIRVYSKGKVLFRGSIFFFFFRVDPIYVGVRGIESKQKSQKLSPLVKVAEYLLCVPSSLNAIKIIG